MATGSGLQSFGLRASTFIFGSIGIYRDVEDLSGFNLLWTRAWKRLFRCC